MVSEPAKLQAGGCAGVRGRLLPLVKGRSPSKPAGRIQRVLLGELSLY